MHNSPDNTDGRPQSRKTHLFAKENGSEHSRQASMESPDLSLSVKAAPDRKQTDLSTGSDGDASSATLTTLASETTTPGSSIVSSGANESCAQELANVLTSSVSHHRSSSSHSAQRPAHLRLPDEVLQIILERVGFPDLWGSAQYVNHAWYRIARLHVFASARFLNLLLTTNFQAFEYTYSGYQEDEDDGPPEPLDEEDCWPGVALDAEETLKYFPELLTSDYCEANDGLRLYLSPLNTCPDQRHPFAINCAVIRLDRLRTVQQRYTVWAINVSDTDSVTVQPLAFDAETGNLTIDLTQCYARLYKIYQDAHVERRKLVDLLEADLWAQWARQHGKYWGKKRAGVFFQGVFIERIGELLESFDNSWATLEDLLQRWDLFFRKTRFLEHLSLHRLKRFSKHARLHTLYKQDDPTWQDVEQRVQLETRIQQNAAGTRFEVQFLRRKAQFARTFAMACWDISPRSDRQSIINFIKRRADDQPVENLLYCMSEQQYQDMLQDWYSARMTSLSENPCYVLQSIAYQLETPPPSPDSRRSLSNTSYASVYDQEDADRDDQ